jgi:hypothetical protein
MGFKVGEFAREPGDLRLAAAAVWSEDDVIHYSRALNAKDPRTLRDKKRRFCWAFMMGTAGFEPATSRV